MHGSNGTTYRTRFDLIETIKRRDFPLLSHVGWVFWPTTGVSSQLLNLLVLLGSLSPLVLWSRRATWNKRDRYAFGLGVIILSETLLFFPLALAVAHPHYYFVPRVFIFLIVCKACLAAVGGHVALNALGRPQKSIEVAAAVMALFLAGRSVDDLSRSVDHRAQSSSEKQPPTQPCAEWNGNYALYTSTVTSPVFTVNFSAFMRNELQRCSQVSPPHPDASARIILGVEAKGLSYFEVMNFPPPGAISLVIAGRPVTLSAKILTNGR